MLISILTIVFILTCLLLIGVILIQKPRGGGLSGAFGGAGGSAQSAFGGKTGDVLTWFTVVLFAGFLLLAIVLTLGAKPDVPDAEPAIMPASDTGAGGAGAGPGRESLLDEPLSPLAPPVSPPGAAPFVPGRSPALREDEPVEAPAAGVGGVDAEAIAPALEPAPGAAPPAMDTEPEEAPEAAIEPEPEPAQ